ncbi:hypothetical protein H0H92_004035, partial [Tricholoma furcatifolium]
MGKKGRVAADKKLKSIEYELKIQSALAGLRDGTYTSTADAARQCGVARSTLQELGHFYLTKLLLPALLAGAKGSSDGKARIVNTSSSAHMSGALNFDTFKDSPKRKKTASCTLYAQSKFGNVVLSNELARRYGDQGIVSTSLNPGNLRSDLQRHVHPVANSVLYLIPWARVGKAVPATDDPALGKRLWDWAEEQTGVRPHNFEKTYSRWKRVDFSGKLKSAFSVDDIPDLAGRVMIVTGANTGKETAKALLAHNAKVYIAARNKEKTEAAIEDLKAATGKEAIFLKVDLADLPSIKAGAEEFLSKEKELHVLFNNGGVMIPPIELLTEQGYDLQFGTNVLGHFYLTKLLLPALLAGAKSSSDGKARVVNTSSSAHMSGALDFNTFKDSPKRKKTASFTLYAQSKF